MLQQKRSQISVKKFGDPFHKKEPALVILFVRMIQPSGSGIFCWNRAVEVAEAVEAVEVAEAAEVIEAAEVVRP